jgi:hypothetical protein
MIIINTYFKKNIKDRDRVKYPVISPKIISANPIDFFIPIENETEIMDYFHKPFESKPKFINSVMVITVNGKKIVDFDKWGLNVWFDYLGGIKEFVEKGIATFNYGHDPVIQMEFLAVENELLFSIDDQKHVVHMKAFLLTLIKEIEHVIVTLSNYQIYHEKSQIYRVRSLMSTIGAFKQHIEKMEQE